MGKGFYPGFIRRMKYIFKVKKVGRYINDDIEICFDDDDGKGSGDSFDCD